MDRKGSELLDHLGAHHLAVKNIRRLQIRLELGGALYLQILAGRVLCLCCRKAEELNYAPSTLTVVTLPRNSSELD